MDERTIEDVKREISRLTMQSVFPEEPIHSINTLEWLLKLDPDSDEALRLAALGHDIERSFADKRVYSGDYESYDEYKQAHALNSAQIMSQIMEEHGLDQETVDDVARLVAHHEHGGGRREDLLKDADKLSFFHVCLPFYYDRKGEEITKKRCVWTYRKLSENLRGIIEEFDYMDEGLKRLVGTTLGFGG